ncbi:hypothetical protein GS909_20010 [Rhodococcus hoagii]|nr:hypothetical protein [Prescottella equi]
MSTKRIDAYEIYCDCCGTQHEGGDYTIWVHASDGIEDARRPIGSSARSAP